MTADKSKRTRLDLSTSPQGWEIAIARQLGIDRETVRRWIGANELPPEIEERIGELVAQRNGSPWPRDDWVIGEAVRTDHVRRTYLTHLEPPRFSARIVNCDANGVPRDEEQPVEVRQTPVYVARSAPGNHFILTEIAWFDPAPSASEVVALFDAAAGAVDVWILGPTEEWPTEG